MRHAFDADHIAAIDNTTRKLMGEGKRPLSVGFWFSLGHSSIVFALALLLSLGVKALAGPVRDDNSQLHSVTGMIGTTVSGVFLYLIAGINLLILVGIWKVFRRMRTGHFDEAALEEQLNNRGLMNRLLGRLMKSISKPWQMYPARHALRPRFRHRHGDRPAGPRRFRRRLRPALVRDPVSAGTVRRGHVAAGHHRRVLHELRLRLGVLQAGPQGLLQPRRRGSVRVAVALIIGTVELLGLLAEKLALHGVFWDWVAGLDLNVLGFPSSSDCSS